MNFSGLTTALGASDDADTIKDGAQMLALQLVLFCALFTGMVRVSVIGGAINALYFYPKDVQELAFERGLADRVTVSKKRKRFMIPFLIVIMTALVFIIGVWNKTSDFKSAYLQSLLFLEVMNWYDGIVIDKIWVGYSKFWNIPGLEGIPYVQSWTTVLKKRGILTVIWVVLAAPAAGLALLLNTIILP